MAQPHAGTLTIEFGPNEFRAEAYKRAAYVMMDRVTCSIRTSDLRTICELELLSAAPSSNIVRDFRREVLDQDLRISIETQTEPMRNLILGLAFSRVGRDDEIS